MRGFWQSMAAANMLLVVLLAALPAFADSLPDEFDKARVTLQRQLRSRQVDERIGALKKLREYPLPDAVRLAHGCFADEEESVRHAAYATLLAINGEQQACDTLVELIERGIRDRDEAGIAPALAALLSSNLPLAQINAQRLLEKSVAKSKLAPEIALAMADGLAVRHEPLDVLPLVRLSKTPMFAENFAVRRAVVAALVKIPTKESLGALVGMLNTAGGEARADACEHLAQVTGQIYGIDGDAWQRWWADAGKTFVYPPSKPAAPYRSVATESSSGYYYGLPLFAERLVFVLDTSGSMNGGRIVAAKRELIKAVSGLPDHVSFGIVVFNGTVGIWQNKLVQANAKNKKAAMLFVESQAPQSTTASYDALAAALTYDTEAIYFLSDGAPTSGKILAPVDIIAAITTVNTKRRISIYTIGIAPGFPGSPTDAFLSALAEQNRGQYRRVDQ